MTNRLKSDIIKIRIELSIQPFTKTPKEVPIERIHRYLRRVCRGFISRLVCISDLDGEEEAPESGELVHVDDIGQFGPGDDHTDRKTHLVAARLRDRMCSDYGSELHPGRMEMVEARDLFLHRSLHCHISVADERSRLRSGCRSGCHGCRRYPDLSGHDRQSGKGIVPDLGHDGFRLHLHAHRFRLDADGYGIGWGQSAL